MNMTRHALPLILVMALIVVMSAGCSTQSLMKQSATVSERYADLRIGINLSAHQAVQGDSIVAIAMLENRGSSPVTIPRIGSEQFRLIVSQYDGVAWQPLKTFPAADQSLLSNWTIQPGQLVHRVFTLPVGPDWPVGQTLRIRAELNGREGVSVADLVTVQPKK